MTRRLMPKFITCLAVLTLSIAALATTSDLPDMDKTVDVNLKDSTLGAAVSTLFKGTNIMFSISANPDRQVHGLTLVNVPLREALTVLTQGTGTRYKIEDGVIMISSIPNWEKTVNIEMKDMPLADALNAMFKGTGKNYVLDPAMQQYRVTAILKNVGFDTALTQVLSALGAAYDVGKEGIYHIRMAPQQVMTRQNSFGDTVMTPPPPSAAPGSVSPQPQGKVTTNIIDTKYINASEAANAIANTPGVSSVSATNNNRVVILATPEGNKNAAQVIAGLDTDKVLPRPIRLKMTIKLTVGTVKGPQNYEATTESVGVEQVPALLNLDMQESNQPGANQAGKLAPQIQRTSLVNAAIVPSINPDGRIGLVGKGRFSFPLDSREVSKEFGITASAVAGKPYTIAAGSMHLQMGKVDFTVTITATPEEGRVYISPSQSNAQQGGTSYGGVGSGGGRSW